MFTAVQKRILFLATMAAVLFPLALPNELFPMGNPAIGLIGLTPLYLALLRASSPRQAAAAGVVFGGISTLIANYWLAFFGDYSIWTIGGTTLGYMIYNAILGPFLWRALRSRPAFRPVLFALVWVGYELLKSVGFLAYPWGLAAYPYNMVLPLIQIADVTGVWGLSFLAVYFCAVLAEFLTDLFPDTAPASARGGWRPVRGRRARVSSGTVRNSAMLAILLVATLTYGMLWMRREIPVNGNLRVLLVQQNADSWNTRDIAGPLQTAQDLTLEGLAAASAPPDLAVWSETSLRFPYNEFRRWFESNPAPQPFTDFVSRLPVPLLTGSPHRGDVGGFTIYNAALLLDQAGDIRQWYGKQQLVPFAEYVPFWESAAVQAFFREVVGISAIWAPGPGYRLFTIERASGSPVSVGTPICFEDAFAYITRRFVRAGADLFINLTNNAWSRTDSAQLQHLVAARFRAVETRRSLIRSTNAGFTGVLDPWGRVTDELPMFVGGYLDADVPVYAPQTTSIYLRWGEYLPVAAIILLVTLLAVSTVRQRGRGHMTSLADRKWGSPR